MNHNQAPDDKQQPEQREQERLRRIFERMQMAAEKTYGQPDEKHLPNGPHVVNSLRLTGIAGEPTLSFLSERLSIPNIPSRDIVEMQLITDDGSKGLSFALLRDVETGDIHYLVGLLSEHNGSQRATLVRDPNVVSEIMEHVVQTLDALEQLEAADPDAN